MDGAVLEHDVYAISWRGTAGPFATAETPANDSAVGTSAGAADFIVGPENRLTGSIILAVLDTAPCWYSPLVLHGPSGTGKSHLAQCVAQARANAVCTRGADFARELAAAVDKDTMSQFRAKYRTCGMFILEDVLQLLGRAGALQEFQHLLDALEARDTPALITSHRPPAEVAQLPPALRSRLSGGLVVAVSSPGTAARQVILGRWAASQGVVLSTAGAKLLAERLNGTAAELRGAVRELEMEATSRDQHNSTKPIDLEHVRRYLLHRRASCQPSLSQITTVVAKYYGLTPRALSSPSRRRQVVLARAMAIYLGRVLCGASLKSLGNHFGGRDHSTALHSFRQLQSRLGHDSALSGTVDTLQRALAGGI
jgi:chromosomal replication initiator protein